MTDDKGQAPDKTPDKPTTTAAESDKQERQDQQEKTEQDSFDRAYVEELRKENAQWRRKLREVEQERDDMEAERKAQKDSELTQQKKFEELAERRGQEVETLKAQLKAAETKALRVTVAAEFGLNIPLDEDGGETLADRLRGETADELRADAARLAKLVKTAKPEADRPADSPDKPADTAPEKPAPDEGGEARRQSTTTAVPGGQPVGKTDVDREREYLRPRTQSPIFEKGEVRLTSKSQSID